MALIIHPPASQGLALWYGASEADSALEHSSDTLTGLLSLANYLAFLSLSLTTCKSNTTVRDLLGAWNTDPLKLAPVKKGKLLEKCRALPHRTQEMTQVPLGPRGAFCLSGATLSLILCSVYQPQALVSQYIDTWPLSATETDQGLLVYKFHILRTANLIGHPPSPLVARWAGSHGPPPTWLRIREQTLNTGIGYSFLQGGPNTSNYPLGDIRNEYVGKSGWYIVGAQ